MKKPLNIKCLAGYIIGMAVLAAGLTLTAMTGLGKWIAEKELGV